MAVLVNGNETLLPMHIIPNHFQDTVVAFAKVGWVHQGWNNHNSRSENVSMFHGSEPNTEYLQTPEHHTDV
jgi:hypothetical protein